MQRIPTLDGWRGVAILLVVVEHLTFYGRFQGAWWANQGALGVDIFFVVSGYIITERLLAEADERGNFSLGDFYRRRVRRILPVTVAYLLILCAISLVVPLGDFDRSEVVASLFFFRNYEYAFRNHGLYTAHFWSLSIEEHFYLLWPALLYFLGRRRGLWVALGGAVACALWRHHDYHGSWVSALLPANAAGLFFHVIRTDTRLDGLLLGCAAALLLRIDQVRVFVYRNFPKETPLLCCFPIFILRIVGCGLPSLACYFCIALALVSTLMVREGLAFQWLNGRILRWVGRISFSLYVWQELFLIHPPGIIPLGRLQMFPFNLVAAFAAATVSYYGIERAAFGRARRPSRALETQPG